MSNLFSPITIKGKEIKNRIVMPPMCMNLATNRGEVNDEHIKHYTLRSKAGVGTIIVEHSFIDIKGKASSGQLGIHTDWLLPGLSKLALSIKKTESLAIIQLSHSGSNSKVLKSTIGPSAVSNPTSTIVPEEMSHEDMKHVKLAFTNAASRAKKAGFDGIEIHGAHGYLLNEFISPLTNKRTDEYGGDLENRMRFPLNVVKAVRETVGERYLIFYRLGCDEHIKGGISLGDSKVFAKELEKYIDVLDVSGGHIDSRWVNMKPGVFVPQAEEIKKTVDVPVIVTGGISDPITANEIIGKGKSDLVGIGRALLKDKNWAEKALEKLKSL